MTDPGRFRFKYLEYAQLEDMGQAHPLLAAETSPAYYNAVNACPGIDDRFPVTFYLEDREKGAIAVRMDAIPDQATVGDLRLNWAWMGGLLTKDAYRRQGLGKILVRHSIQQCHDLDLVWGGVFSTDVALHIYEKLGMIIPGHVSRYLAFKTLRPLLKHHLAWEPAVLLADGLYRLSAGNLLRLLSLPARGLELERHDLGAGERPSSWPDRQRLRPNFFLDGMERILWKANNVQGAAGLVYQLYVLKYQGEPQGFFIARTWEQKKPLAGRYQDFRLQSVMDFGFFQDRPRDWGLLLGGMLKAFWRSNADVLEIINNYTELSSLMKRRGILPVGKGMSYTFAPRADWRPEVAWQSLSTWHLPHFSGDGFSL